MIVEGIFNAFFGLAKFLVGLIPQSPSFQELYVSLQPILYVIKMINMFVSVRSIGVCLGIVLIVYNIKFVWSIVMWILRKIPGVS